MVKNLFLITVCSVLAISLFHSGCKSKPAGESDETGMLLESETTEESNTSAAALAEELRKTDEARKREEAELAQIERAQNITGEPSGTQTEAVNESELELIRQLQEEKKREALVHEEYSQNCYDLAKKLFTELKYDEALEQLEKAIQANPAYVEAKRLRDDIRVLKGEYIQGNEGQLMQNLVDDAKVKIQQAVAEVGSHITRGRQYYQTQDFDKAEKEFNLAIEQVNRFPEQIDLTAYKAEAESLLKKATEKRRQKDVEYKKELEKKAREEEQARETLLKREFNQMLEQLYRQAQMAFENGRLEETEILCQQILDQDPGSWLAEELMGLAKAAKHFKANKEILEKYKNRWKDFMAQIDLSSVLQNQIVTFTDRETWEMIIRRKPTEFSTKGELEFSERDAEVNALLDSFAMRVEFEESNTLTNIIEFLRKNSGINILFDERKLTEGSKDPNSIEIPGFSMNSRLREILKFVLDFSGLDYRIKNGAVIITMKTDVSGETVVRVYDTQDLNATLVDFPAPEFTLADPEVPEDADTTSPLVLPIDQIIELIKGNIEPTSWEDTESGVNISGLQNKLMVTQTPVVQEQIEKFLNGIRQSAGILVSVEGKFLTVQDNFIEDIGIDWRGLNATTGAGGAIAPDGTGAPPLSTWALTNLGQPVFNYDTTTTLYAGAGAVPAPTPGIWSQFRGGENDLRARVENILVNDGLVSTFFNDVFNATGGTSLMWTLIDDTKAELILRAVRKDERSRVLLAPQLTLFNGQRGHVIAGEQVVYIRDYNIEIAAGAATPRPILASFNNGTALDVRPIVSADKKYITVEMRPTAVTPIVDIRQSFIVTRLLYPDSGPPGVNSVRIELPILQIQKVRTTVTIPDQGTIILGGLSEVADLAWEAEIPLVDNIPIFGKLVSREAKGTRRKAVLIMVKATIIIMEEQERKRFGRLQIQ